MFGFLKKVFGAGKEAGLAEFEQELAGTTEVSKIAALAVILGPEYQDKVIERLKVVGSIPVPEMAVVAGMAKVAGLTVVFDYLRGQLEQVQDLKDWLFIAKFFKGVEQTLSDAALVKAEALAMTFKDWVNIYKISKSESDLKKRALAKLVELAPKDKPDVLADIYDLVYEEDPNDPRLEQLMGDLLAWMQANAKSGQWYALLGKAPEGSPLENAAIEGYKASDRS